MRRAAIEGGMSDEHDKSEGANERSSASRDLIARCLDGVASDIEAAELSRLIAGDPEVARELARAAQLESSLEVVLRGDPRAATPAPRAERASRWTRSWPIWTVTAIAAAAAVVLIASSGKLSAPKQVVVASTKMPEPLGRLRFDDGSTADLRDKDSQLDTRLSTPTAIDLVLARGSARFEVTHRAGRRFRIWVGGAYVEVIGTIFTVERLPAGVRVSVERGIVKVVSKQNEMRLSEGTAEVIPIDDAADTQAAAKVEAKERAHDRAAPRAQPGAAQPNAASDETGALLQASEDARRNGNPQAAATVLRKLLDRHPHDPRASYAAFILGRVLLEELHRPRDAAAAFARVEALDAKTPLVEDALAREVESWSRAGDLAKARERAGLFLSRYPNGSRADEVRRYSRME
jgi:transmembrane sensor